MATTYRPIYIGDFCDEKLGSNIDVTISRRMDTEDPIPTPIEIQFAGATNSPVSVEFADDGDYKLNTINGSSCEVKIKAIDTFELSSLYTADEKEWRIDIDGGFKWSGFLIPDSCNEPYMSKPYDVSVTATDSLGALKDLDFALDDGVKLTGFMSDKNILSLILGKTNLNLAMTIAVNTFELTMDRDICPLSQSYVDVAAYYQEDGTPYTCEEVLNDILNRWSSRLHQFNGVWQIVNVLEKSFGDIDTWEFNSAGGVLPRFSLGNNITVGGVDRTLQPRGANNSFAKALAESKVYYKYGYATNEVANGSFDDCVPPAMPNGWSAVGTVTFFTYFRIDEKTGLTTTDVKLVIENTDTGAYIMSDNVVQVRSLEKTLITFDLRSIEASESTDLGDKAIFVLIKDNLGNFFTNEGWGATSGFYVIRRKRKDFGNDISVNFEVDPQTVDYDLTIGIKNVYSNDTGSLQHETQFDNVKVQPQTAPGLQKPPLGVLKKYALKAPQSYKRDNILLLHGDEYSDQRTSRISIGSDTVITPPVTWTRAEYPLENLPLLNIVADTELRMHSRPYRVFEAEFVGTGYIDINTLLTVDLLEGTYIFLSGKFDLKLGIHRLRFAQVLTDPYDYYELPATEDYGDLNN